MTRFTDVNFKLISDIEKYHFFKNMIKGGVLFYFFFQVYAEVNNELLKPYDNSNSKTWIIGEDDNDLYEHSMMQSLPFEIPDFVDPENFNLDNYCSIGCVSEVDLD